MSGSGLSWDYTSLADAYLHRPQYADVVVDAVLDHARLTPPDRTADIGAGTGNLTTLLLERGYKVDAVEPNAAMCKHGIAQTERFGEAVKWTATVAEDTQLPRGAYGLVTFGSSFNVVDAQGALREAAAILRPRGWFMCCWNHRDIEDPLQRAVEGVIRRHLPNYVKGARAEDPSPVIADSGLFEPAQYFCGRVVHRVRSSAWLTAWKSHATLSRQAGARLEAIISEIGEMLDDEPMVDVPYITNTWLARRAGADG